MVKRILFFIVILIVFSTGIIHAQDSQTWYWAVNEETGQLVAYTADGRVNTLVESGIEKNFQIGRLSEDAMLATLRLDGESKLYHLAPDGFYPIQITNEDNFNAASYGFNLVKTHLPYALLIVPMTSTSYQVLMINVETNSAWFLTGILPESNIVFTPIPAAFSSDNHYLRYATANEDDNNTWILRELKLETGEERSIYQTNADVNLFTLNSAGDYWLSSAADFDTNVWVFTLIPETGSSQIIAEEPDANVSYREIQGEFLITYPPKQCESDCVLELKLLLEGNSQRYSLNGLHTDKPSRVSYISGANYALVRDGLEYWVVGADGSSESIGFYSKIVATKALSEDQRWLFVVDDYAAPSHYRVWDIANRQYVLENDDDSAPSKALDIVYGTNGFIILKDDRSVQVYRYSDGKTFDIPRTDGDFIDVLSDGNALFSQEDANEIGGTGIYRYDPETASYTLLVADVVPLVSP